jgi:hypothetical protein
MPDDIADPGLHLNDCLPHGRLAAGLAKDVAIGGFSAE